MPRTPASRRKPDIDRTRRSGSPESYDTCIRTTNSASASFHPSLGSRYAQSWLSTRGKCTNHSLFLTGSTLPVALSPKANPILHENKNSYCTMKPFASIVQLECYHWFGTNQGLPLHQDAWSHRRLPYSTLLGWRGSESSNADATRAAIFS